MRINDGMFVIRRCSTAVLLAAASILCGGQAPAPAVQQPDVMEASYGVHADTKDRVGDVTALIRNRCEKRRPCTFPVSNNEMGMNPAPKDSKRLMAIWRCGHAVEAAFVAEGAVALIVCSGEASGPDLIRIESATWGDWPGGGPDRLSVKHRLESLCRAASRCLIPVSNRTFGDDPKPGDPGKTLQVVYQCGSKWRTETKPENGIAELKC